MTSPPQQHDAPSARHRLFDPDAVAAERPVPNGHVRYIYEDSLKLAINVAMAAERPLLLRGAPGSGKTTLAADVARLLGRRFEPEVVTSRTQAQHLESRFDAVRRLADAQGDEAGRQRAQDAARYLAPGVLWRAFHPELAAEYGAPIEENAPRDVVVLLDEIDKADPDIPNDLLMVLDQRWFLVPELPKTKAVVRLQDGIKLFMVITSNGERELTPAFLRRCVSYALPDPDDDRLREIGRSHFPGVNAGLLDAVIQTMRDLNERARLTKQRAPSTAELVDALRACDRLGITSANSPDWEAVAQAAMWKHPPQEKKKDAKQP